MACLTSAAESSPWAFGWDFFVAVGTIGLAAVTGWLAWSTRGLASETKDEVAHSGRLVEASQRQVEATQEQARTAQEALAAAQEQTRLARLTLNAQTRPVLIDVPINPAASDRAFLPGGSSLAVRGGAVHVDSENGLISVPVRNAGTGLAMIRGVSLEAGEPIPSPLATIRPANVAPGEHARVGLRVPSSPPVRRALAARDGAFSVVVAYTDLAGQQLTISRFDVSFDARTLWEVRQVHLQEPDAEVPYAGSGPTG